MNQESQQGRFITLEGGEGVGKTTNLAFIKDYLEDRGIDLVVTREPGGTALSEAVRSILLDKQYKGMHPDAELLLVFAARAEHVQQKIKPALARGQWVLSDRFTDASFAYQGGGRKMGFQRISQLEQLVLSDFQPDLTLFLDADIALGMSRVEQRMDKDRFEQEQDDFFYRVQSAYRQRALDFPERIKTVNAQQTLDKVQNDIRLILDGII